MLASSARAGPVGVQGRLEWREWESQEGQKRQAVDIIADSVQFLGGRDDGAQGNGFGTSGMGASARSDVPVDDRDFQAAPSSVGASVGDDDIPF